MIRRNQDVINKNKWDIEKNKSINPSERELNANPVWARTKRKAKQRLKNYC